MPSKPLFRHIFNRLLLLVFPLLLLLLSWHFYSVRHYEAAAEGAALRQTLDLLTPTFEPLIIKSTPTEIQEQCRKYLFYKKIAVSVILPDGTVIGDSQQRPDLIANQAFRQDVAMALQRPAESTSQFLRNDRGVKTSYLSRAFYNDGTARAILSVSQQLNVQPLLSPASWLFYLLVLLGTLLLAAITALLLTRLINEPLGEIAEVISAFSRGDFQARFLPSEITELAKLSNEMNMLTSGQHEQIATISHQLHQQEAILSGMTEGVVAVDKNESIISINSAAARLLALDSRQATGRIMQEIIRNVNFQNFVGTVFASKTPVDGEIILRDGSERYLLANGVKLFDATGKTIGAVIVLNDLTRIRKLENMRQEFVANVSHELRTPITAIKGFVETLLDGALDNREDSEHFLQVIARQVDRMNVLIEDLLLLSTLEQSGQRTEIGMETGNIKEIIQHAIAQCQLAAQAKEIEIQFDCPAEINIMMVAPLIEQAVVNLLDNAIKYSGEKTTVLICAGKTAEGVQICVVDQGNGIANEHLARIFERFYRVDKARSRKVGGTGLGLSIVKHIALSHGGRVEVASEVGKGSTFTIFLPMGHGESK